MHTTPYLSMYIYTRKQFCSFLITSLNDKSITVKGSTPKEKISMIKKGGKMTDLLSVKVYP